MPKSSSFLYYIVYIAIGFFYPAYCSLVALQTPEKTDDVTWLIYWIVFAIFNIIETATDFLLFWVPLYPVCKLGFLLWCSAPVGRNGAYYLYKLFIEPFYYMYGEQVNFILNRAVDVTMNFSDYLLSYCK